MKGQRWFVDDVMSTSLTDKDGKVNNVICTQLLASTCFPVFAMYAWSLDEIVKSAMEKFFFSILCGKKYEVEFFFSNVWEFF